MVLSCVHRTTRPTPTDSPRRRFAEDLSSSIWLWHRKNGEWSAQKVIEIPAEPADPAQLPELL